MNQDYHSAQRRKGAGRRKEDVAALRLPFCAFAQTIFRLETELSIYFVRIAYPFVRPAHPSHDVPFVINLDDVDQFSGAGDNLV